MSVCLSLSCSPQHCLSRTSPCTWQCLYPILMPCTSLEGLLVARPWQQPQPPSVTVGCCPLHRHLCTGMWAQVEALRGPPVQAAQVSGNNHSHMVKVVYWGWSILDHSVQGLLLCFVWIEAYLKSFLLHTVNILFLVILVKTDGGQPGGH